MRIFTTFILVLPALAAARVVERDVSAALEARPASVPTSGSPLATTGVGLDVLQLRQDENLIPANNIPAVDPAVPAAPAAPAAALQPAIPLPLSTTTPPTTTSTTSFAPGVYSEFTTIQWVETWIGSTYSTWVPKTIVLHFRTMSPAPPPGRGEIGMGTLTGETQQQTVVMGAAPSQGPDWVRGVVAAIGVGVAGFVV